VSHTRTALIADPQPMFRAGLAAALGRAGIDVVAEAATSAEAVSAAARYEPGICVIDAALPGGAIGATKRIAVRSSHTMVIVLGSAHDDEALIAFVRAGACGYLPRSSSVSGLARAVAGTLEGNAAITRAGVGALVRELRAHNRRRSTIDGSSVSLTDRETRVVELLRDGLKTQEIADELGLSPVTVRRHVGSVAQKVGAEGRNALLRALQTG
jgi:DNA-binding NarL/FixJ family response regulator